MVLGQTQWIGTERKRKREGRVLKKIKEKKKKVWEVRLTHPGSFTPREREE